MRIYENSSKSTKIYEIHEHVSGGHLNRRSTGPEAKNTKSEVVGGSAGLVGVLPSPRRPGKPPPRCCAPHLSPDCGRSGCCRRGCGYTPLPGIGSFSGGGGPSPDNIAFFAHRPRGHKIGAGPISRPPAPQPTRQIQPRGPTPCRLHLCSAAPHAPRMGEWDLKQP